MSIAMMRRRREVVGCYKRGVIAKQEAVR